jgi:UDP-N-acetylglucosamine--N-acetylmuramyl-(pentapeptide) pyrophosphoryl-undecaprenol N-acetylglucosamine transferase
VIAGGGTGGHVQPAVATLQALRLRRAIEPVWIGSNAGLERSAAEAEGVPFRAIQTGKLRRYLAWQTPIDALRIPFGVGQAFLALRSLRPAVVFSTGGFVSVPTVVAARSLGVPALTHEQTARTGLATRINARFCTVIALSFEESRRHLDAGTKRVVVTGNPIRRSLLEGDADRARSRFGLEPALPVVYITGGAQGAHAINETVEQALPRLLDRCQIIHQCGPAAVNQDAPRLERTASRLPEALRRRYVLREFIRDELADIYAVASLVVGRAGAGTVAEIAALGKPSVLIPLPGAGGDEQTANARVLVDRDAGILIPQSELTEDRLVVEIDRLLTSGRLPTMADNARKAARLDAADRLADEILALADAATGSKGFR